MLSAFFNVFSDEKKWRLKPLRYPKGSENHYSSKVLLPYSMLQELLILNFQPPYIFEISHENNAFRTCCSVLDFELDRSEVHIPDWMYDQIDLENSDRAVLTYIRLERGNGIKLLPHSPIFLEVENPKLELEKSLRNYPVLSYGDEILLNFEDIGHCRFTITQIYPETLDSIYLVDTDLNVDFDEPLGYQEKLESEKTVLKYAKIGNEKRDVKSFNLKKVGLFLDWESLNNQNSKEGGKN